MQRYTLPAKLREEVRHSTDYKALFSRQFDGVGIYDVLIRSCQFHGPTFKNVPKHQLRELTNFPRVTECIYTTMY